MSVDWIKMEMEMADNSNSLAVVEQPVSMPAIVDKKAVQAIQNGITILNMTEMQYDRLLAMSKMFELSSFNPVKQKRTQADYFLIMTKGLELGLSPMASVDCINIIEGKPTLDAKGMLALAHAGGELQDIHIDGDSQQCTVTVTRKGKMPHTETFTMQDARSMNLTGKYNWKNMPATMLKWRAITAAIRVTFPDRVAGLYTPEEIDPENTSVSDDGGMVHQAPIQIEKPADKPQLPDAKPTIEWPSEAAIEYILNMAKGKGWGDTEADLLEMLDGKRWSDFETGKDAVAAIENNYATLETESAMDDIGVSIGGNVTKALYWGKYIEFKLQGKSLRWYKGRTELAAAVGEPYATQWDITNWKESGSPLVPAEYAVDLLVEAVEQETKPDANGKTTKYWNVVNVIVNDDLADLPGPSTHGKDGKEKDIA